jgi:hypothetical protein
LLRAGEEDGNNYEESYLAVPRAADSCFLAGMGFFREGRYVRLGSRLYTTPVVLKTVVRSHEAGFDDEEVLMTVTFEIFWLALLKSSIYNSASSAKLPFGERYLISVIRIFYRSLAVSKCPNLAISQT